MRILLIGGNRKSGTSMLHSLFDHHPDVFVPPHDLNILYGYYPEWVAGGYTDSERKNRLEKVIFEPWGKAYEDYSGQESETFQHFSEQLRSQIEYIDLSNIKEIIDAIVTSYEQALPNQYKYLVLKETSTEMYVPWLLKERPNWQFLHLFRDPRDNYAALQAGQSYYYAKLGNDDMDTISSLILRYKFGLKWCNWNTATFGENRYKTIRFEDVVESTHLTMEAVANWLGITMHESLTVPTKQGQSFEGNNHDGVKFNGISAQNLGKWKVRISEEEARIIEFMLADEMKDLGYEAVFDENESAVLAGDWYAKMNFKYFFADPFEHKASI